MEEETLHEPLVQSEEEEKEPEKKGAFGTTLPNIHPNMRLDESMGPYAVPSFDSSHFARDEDPNARPLDVLNSQKMNIGVSGLYVVVAVLMVIQGFGILISGSLSQFFLGLYTMSFGAIAILFDLRVVVMDINIEQWFPFLGNYFGRSMTVFFFALLAEQSAYGKNWNLLIMIFDIIVAVFYIVLHLAARSMKPASNNVV